MPEWLQELSATAVMGIALLMVLKSVLRDIRQEIRVQTAAVLGVHQQILMILPAVTGISNDGSDDKVAKVDQQVSAAVRSIEELRQLVIGARKEPSGAVEKILTSFLHL